MNELDKTPIKKKGEVSEFVIKWIEKYGAMNYPNTIATYSKKKIKRVRSSEEILKGKKKINNKTSLKYMTKNNKLKENKINE